MASVIELLELWGCKELASTARSRVFFSPFRDEKQGSFHVYKDSGRWKDFGHVGIDGNDKGNLFILVKEYLHSRGMAYENKDVFAYLKEQNIEYETAPINNDPIEYKPEVKIVNTSLHLDKVLWNYLYYERGITKKWLINRYLLQVNFELKGKSYYAVGFKNDKGSYELRNKFWKGASGKSITTIPGQNEVVDVFEGFTDLMTHDILYLPYYEQRENHAIVMNSKSMLNDTIDFIIERQFKKINLWKHNDQDGDKVLKALCDKTNHLEIVDHSDKYSNFNDLNEAHVSGTFQKNLPG